jgi:CRP/FNR family transcriptional regulator, cyclic AMP receptor protein
MDDRNPPSLDLSWRPVTFAPGEIVIRAGDLGDAFYVIVRGRAGVAGKSLSRTLREGDYFGEIALIDGGPRSATVIALDELRTIEIQKAAFLTFLEREPGVARRIMASLAKRVRALERAPAPKERAPSSWPIPGLS